VGGLTSGGGGEMMGINIYQNYLQQQMYPPGRGTLGYKGRKRHLTQTGKPIVKVMSGSGHEESHKSSQGTRDQNSRKKSLFVTSLRSRKCAVKSSKTPTGARGADCLV